MGNKLIENECVEFISLIKLRLISQRVYQEIIQTEALESHEVES